MTYCSTSETSILQNGDDYGRIRAYKPSYEETDTRHNTNCDLEPNHTHFLLFDNGKEHLHPDKILEKRREIEKELAKALKYSIIGYDPNN
ncbi:unnamed protein product, partial [Didymodactylos carnosus]